MYTFQLVKVAFPHVALLIFCGVYILVGTQVFIWIDNSERTPEEDHRTALVEAGKQLQRDSWALRKENRLTKPNLQAVYKEYEASVVAAYRKRRTTKAKRTILNQSFLQKMLTTATALSSVGYGSPVHTQAGRVVATLYILVGLPLFLITIADMAYFCSNFTQRLYVSALTVYYRIKAAVNLRWFADRTSSSVAPLWRQKQTRDKRLSVHIPKGATETAEFLWECLETTTFVEPPFLFMYMLLIAYIAVGAAYFCHCEQWTYLDSFYFVTISLLTIGFGDIVPKNQWYMVVSLVYILIGLVIGTSCVEMAGTRYVRKIHLFGRQVAHGYDPFLWLQLAQRRRVKEMKNSAMRNIMATLNALAYFGQRVPMKKPSSRMSLRKLTRIKVMTDQFVDTALSYDPPNPPRNFKSVATTSASVTLAWDPPSDYDSQRATNKVWYTLAYRHRNIRKPDDKSELVVIDYLVDTSYTLNELDPFTLYEFNLTSTNISGCSVVVRTEEYTEPSTVPQNVEVCGSEQGILVKWEDPRRNRENQPKRFTVHYSADDNLVFVEWRHCAAAGANRLVLPDADVARSYWVAVSADHNRGLASMSKHCLYTPPAVAITADATTATSIPVSLTRTTVTSTSSK